MHPKFPRQNYSWAEYRSDTIVHFSGLALVLISVPALISLTVILHGDNSALISTSIYGASFAAMIVCSALYNIFSQSRWAWLLQRLDHSAIYAKIAGTYTPFTLLSGTHAPWLLGGLWGAAFAGMGLKILSPTRFRWLAIGLYIAMGWAGLLAGSAFLATLSTAVLVLIVTGGLLYTVGVFFYLFDRLPFHYTIWHVFVLTASMLLYAAVTLHVIQTA